MKNVRTIIMENIIEQIWDTAETCISRCVAYGVGLYVLSDVETVIRNQVSLLDPYPFGVITGNLKKELCGRRS